MLEIYQVEKLLLLYSRSGNDCVAMGWVLVIVMCLSITISIASSLLSVPTSLVLVQKQLANIFVTTKMHHYTVDEI